MWGMMRLFTGLLLIGFGLTVVVLTPLLLLVAAFRDWVVILTAGWGWEELVSNSGNGELGMGVAAGVLLVLVGVLLVRLPRDERGGA